ncbi:MAG: zinc-binding alcohol dehydrogenase [Anaerolineae bacterium]|nr:zinc-binding alcohol dehydrogenase [Anaerolineae bacterium]
MPHALQLMGPRDLQFIAYDEHPLQPHAIRAQAVLSGISHGTELNLYRGTAPFHEKHFDTDLRLFLPGQDKIDYLAYLGYEWVGRVTEVGAAIDHLQVGDLVHMPLPHRETHTFVPENWPNRGRIEPLPPEIQPEDAIFLALAGVALQTVHDARIKTGDRVVIFGMGAIGLLAVQLARINGATWIDVVDPISLRRDLAVTYGADRALDPAACDVSYEIKSASPHRGADVAIEVSGHYAALHEAIRAVRKAGVVVAGGYYQGGGTALHLGEEWHHNRVTMLSSMAVWDCPHRDYPAWDRVRIHATVTDLLAQGRLKTEGIISHRFPYDRAAEAYQLIDQHAEQTVKVVLTY